MIQYKGEIHYTFNMFDGHVKTCEFNLLSDQPMTYNVVKHQACEQCQRQLGLAQCIKTVVYTETYLNTLD